MKYSRIAALFAAAATTAGLGIVGGSPASAASVPCMGDTFSLCLYTNSYYGGEQLTRSKGDWDPSLPGLGGFDNRISSINSNHGKPFCFYSERNYQGEVFRIGPWEEWATLPGWIDNDIQSFRVC
ncbi:peptidase inhibitor family I36 protein [Streptomyces sp. NPDC035033]|uniref:peptidase inhibitor family I36 protein n=1 Tax=Streptomyces sp. NPDC035033 TaxID=3155368 RepID=UPI00340F138A